MFVIGGTGIWMHLLVPPPPRVQEPAMFDRGTRGRFLRTLFPQNSTAEPGGGSCTRRFLDTGGGGIWSGCSVPVQGQCCLLLFGRVAQGDLSLPVRQKCAWPPHYHWCVCVCVCVYVFVCVCVWVVGISIGSWFFFVALLHRLVMRTLFYSERVVVLGDGLSTYARLQLQQDIIAAEQVRGKLYFGVTATAGDQEVFAQF